MSCPHCLSTSTSKRKHRTLPDYRTFFCRVCGRRFNERTGSPFCIALDELRNYMRVSPTDGEHVPTSHRRQIFAGRWSALVTELAA